MNRRDLLKGAAVGALAACAPKLVKAQKFGNTTVLEDGQTITVTNELPGPHATNFWKHYASVKDRFHFVTPTFRTNDKGIQTHPRIAGATETYTNWSGGVVYAAPGTCFTTVQGDFTIPDVVASTLKTWQNGVYWIGLDGDGSPDVCQAGIWAQSYFINSSDYLCDLSLWHEWYPQKLVVASGIYFRAGDLISLTITTTGPGATSAMLTVLNATNGAASSYTFTAPAGTVLVGNSAEWISEAPQVNGTIATIPDYGKIYFGDCTATQTDGTVVNGGTGNNINLVQNNVELSAGTLLTPNVVECAYIGATP